MLNVIAIVLVLGALIFFHELGHFLIAKLLGVGVKTFSLGFGPKLLSCSGKSTEYRLSAIPLGGYVQLVGEDPDSEIPENFTLEQSFSARPPWQRMSVVAAGPVFNFVLAWFIYWGIFVGAGQQALLPKIGKVQNDTPAHAAGLEQGDLIKRVNGQKIQYWGDLAEFIRKSRGEELRLTVQREGSRVKFHLEPEVLVSKNIFGEEIKSPKIGIVASGDTVRIEQGFFQASWSGMKQMVNLLRLTWTGIIKMIEGVVPLKEIGGPIMIAQLTSEQAEKGLVNVLGLTALISINLGLLNLLPIPVLDGGHLLFYAIEIVLRRPLDYKWRMLAIKIGITLVIALMVLAVYNDIYRLLHTK